MNMIYLILLFTILFFNLAWRRLDWAAMFLIATLPSYLIRFNIFGLPATLLEAMIWVVFIVWLIKNFSQVKSNFLKNFRKKDEKVKIRYLFDWEIVLLLFIALIAAGVAGFHSGSLGIWKAYFFEPALFFIVVLNIMKGERGREKILWSLAVSALAVSALAIFQCFTGALIDNSVWAAEGTRRVVSFFGYPNAVGLYLGPLVLVMMGWFLNVILERSDSGAIGSQGNSIGRRWRSSLQNDKIKTVFISLTIILSTLSIYFAKSKGALLGITVGLTLFGLMVNKKIRRATLVAILILAAGIMIYQPARKLADETITFKTLSGQIRIAGWSDAWRMLKNGRLLTGAGLANFQPAVAPYHTPGIFIKDFSDPDYQRKLVFNEAYRTAHWQPLEIYLYPHNIILNFWSELGLAGLLLFIWIIIKYFWMGMRVLLLRGVGNTAMRQSREQDDRGWLRSSRLLAMADRYIVIGLICAMAAIVVHGMVDVPYFKNDLAVMFWLLVAIMSMICLENNYGKNIQ